MMKRKRRLKLLLMPIIFLSGVGLVILNLVWADGPPLWWVLRGSHVEKVIVRWDKQKIEISDSQQVQQFYSAVLSGSAPLPYPTRCLPDKHRENWSVTFIRSGQSPFQVQVGTDTCGTFFVPTVGSTYHGGKLMGLIEAQIKAS